MIGKKRTVSDEWERASTATARGRSQNAVLTTQEDEGAAEHHADEVHHDQNTGSGEGVARGLEGHDVANIGGKAVPEICHIAEVGRRQSGVRRGQ